MIPCELYLSVDGAVGPAVMSGAGAEEVVRFVEEVWGGEVEGIVVLADPASPSSLCFRARN